MAKLKSINDGGTFSIFSYVGDVQGCGTIRIIWPHFLLNHYRYKKIKFSAFFAPYFVHHPDFYKNYGICQFQRSASESHLQIFQHFKNVIKKQINCALITSPLISIPTSPRRFVSSTAEPRLDPSFATGLIKMTIPSSRRPSSRRSP